MPSKTTSAQFENDVVACRDCLRLVAWREDVARTKTKRFADEEYWGKPVPSFGSVNAELIIVGLAPAAHGANRTGRMFTGDRSGDWLYEALHAFGFASSPTSASASDGLRLVNTRITAVAHCAPPQNKLTAEEIRNCHHFLETELQLCRKAKVYLALGSLAFREIVKTVRDDLLEGTPVFAHGVTVRLGGNRLLIASYHPSQQNTFTGQLTREMFHEIFASISRELQKNS